MREIQRLGYISFLVQLSVFPVRREFSLQLEIIISFLSQFSLRLWKFMPRCDNEILLQLHIKTKPGQLDLHFHHEFKSCYQVLFFFISLAFLLVEVRDKKHIKN